MKRIRILAGILVIIIGIACISSCGEKERKPLPKNDQIVRWSGTETSGKRPGNSESQSESQSNSFINSHEPQTLPTALYRFEKNLYGKYEVALNAVSEGADFILLPASYKGDPVTGIMAYGFSFHQELFGVEIPDSILTVNEYAFAECDNLSTVIFNPGLEGIETCAFTGCDALTEVMLPLGLVHIGEGAFEDCTSLEFVTLPKSLLEIGDDAFLNCTKLTDVYYDGTVAEWLAIRKGGAIFWKTCVEFIICTDGMYRYR